MSLLLSRPLIVLCWPNAPSEAASTARDDYWLLFDFAICLACTDLSIVRRNEESLEYTRYDSWGQTRVPLLRCSRSQHVQQIHTAATHDSTTDAFVRRTVPGDGKAPLENQ